MPQRTFFDTLITNFPEIAGYVFIIFLTGYIVWKSACFYIKTSKSCDDVPKMKATLDRIEKSFNSLNQVLLEKNVISNSCFSKGNSPRELNEKGEKLYKESGAETLFNSLKEELIKDLLKEKHDSFLELERNSFKVLLDRMDDPEFKEIQNFAYNNPRFEGRPLVYSDILFIISLKLRNLYIEKCDKSL